MSEIPRRTTLLAIAIACVSKIVHAGDRFYSRAKVYNRRGIPKRAFDVDRVLGSQSLIAVAGAAAIEAAVTGSQTVRRKVFTVPQTTLQAGNVVLSDIALALYEQGSWACTGVLTMPKEVEGEGRAAVVQVIVRAYAGTAELPISDFTHQPRLWETRQRYSVLKGQSRSVSLMPVAGLEGGQVFSHLGVAGDETRLSPGEQLYRHCTRHFTATTHLQLTLERLQPA